MVAIEEVPYHSAFYDAIKALRDEVLRRPIGLCLSERDIEGEESQIHIAALDDNRQVIGSVILKPLSDTTLKLRQMAVAAAYQGRGIGREIVLVAEALARARHFRDIELNARVYAQGFYEKLGYAATGDIFTEVNLPTIKMIKRI